VETLVPTWTSGTSYRCQDCETAKGASTEGAAAQSCWRPCPAALEEAPCWRMCNRRMCCCVGRRRRPPAVATESEFHRSPAPEPMICHSASERWPIQSRRSVTCLSCWPVAAEVLQSLLVVLHIITRQRPNLVRLIPLRLRILCFMITSNTINHLCPLLSRSFIVQHIPAGVIAMVPGGTNCYQPQLHVVCLQHVLRFVKTRAARPLLQHTRRPTPTTLRRLINVKFIRQVISRTINRQTNT